jgi:hypothetical protein
MGTYKAPVAVRRKLAKGKGKGGKGKGKAGAAAAAAAAVAATDDEDDEDAIGEVEHDELPSGVAEHTDKNFLFSMNKANRQACSNIGQQRSRYVPPAGHIAFAQAGHAVHALAV